MHITDNMILRTEQFDGGETMGAAEFDLHIAFGIDANFARGMGILIQSISVQNPDKNVAYHVFTDGIAASDLERLKRAVSRSKVAVKLYYINLASFKDFPTTLAWSYATYYRFIMGKFLHGVVDRVLYLDADILCIGCLDALMRVELRDYIVAAVSEIGDYNVKRLSLKNGKYFNAGVLFIDINRWNEAAITEKSLELLNANPGGYPYLDQDVLNIVLDGKTLFIDRCWNYLYDMRKMDSELPEEVAFVHFIGDKPWQCWTEHHFMARRYNEFASFSQWRDVCLDKPKHYKEKKRLARSYAKKGMYMKALAWYFKYAVGKMNK